MRNCYKSVRSILPALLIFLFCPILLLFGCAEDTAVTETNEAKFITPFFASETSLESEIQIVHYPELPAPGDFLLIEAGPVDNSAFYELDFDFPGTASGFYQSGGLLYAMIAISCDTEPGPYSLTMNSDDPEITDREIPEKVLVIGEKEFRLSRFSMPPERTEGWTAARLAEDREKVRLARETTEPYPLWMNRFISPLEGRISSEYGAIRIINNNPPRRHSGLDIAADEGAPIIAPNNGIVRLAEFLLSGGNTVIIDHGIGLSSTYMHLDTIAVEKGQKIARGELIGTVGMTGYATGNHLHWEVNIGQHAVNPEQLVDNDLLWVPPAYAADFLDHN